MNDIYCAACAYYDDKGQCSNPEGLLHNIRISEAMSEAEHDCAAFREAVYTLSEAGHLDSAMREEGINVEFKVVKRICDRFFERMMSAGMLSKEENESKEI